MRRIIITICSVTALVSAGRASGEVLPTAGDAAGARRVQITAAFLNQLSEEARTNHPSLRAARARVDASVANTQSVRVWEDPRFEFGGMLAEERMRSEEGDLLYGVEQMLPLFGKPRAGRRMAEAGAATAAATADAEFQQLRRDIAMAALRTALAHRTVEIGAQDLAWVETQVEVVQRRYETGDATQFDVLRLQNERATRETRLQTDREQLRQEHVNLNRMLNRPLDSPWAILDLPEVAGPVAYSSKLVELAVRYEPELIVHREEIREAEAAVEVARRERYPDIALSGELRQYSGSGEARQGMVALSLNIPWGNRGRYRAAIRREQENVKAAQLEAADFELGLRSDIHNLTVKIDAARREALTYRDQIVPRSEAALESARGAWEAGRGGLRDVLDARRMLLDAELMEARAVTEQYQAMAELVLCCGLGDLEALQMIGVLPDETENTNRPETK